MSAPSSGSVPEPGSSVDPSPSLIRAPGRPRDQRASRAITEAAIRQLDDIGYAAISMESVASEAGVARATIYRRYRDKADLVTSAIAEHAAEIPARPSGDPKADLCRFLVEFDRRFGAAGMGVLGALMTNRDDADVLELHRERVIAPRLAYGRQLLEQARSDGDLRPDADIDLAFQMLSGSVFHRRVAGVESEPGWAERAVDTIWRGMGPRSVRAGGRGARQKSP